MPPGSPRRASKPITGTSPPGPLRCGSTTCSTKPAAAAASKALPPDSRAARPAAEASQCVDATMPNVPASSGLVVNSGISAITLLRPREICASSNIIGYFPGMDDDLEPRVRAVCDLNVAEAREYGGRHEYDGVPQDLSPGGVAAGLARLAAAAGAGEAQADPHDE